MRLRGLLEVSAPQVPLRVQAGFLKHPAIKAC